MATITYQVRHSDLNSSHAIAYISAYVFFESRPGATTQASGFVRRLCCLKGQVQQRPPHLPTVLCQRFAMHLWRIEETRQARTHTKEEPRWHAFHQRIEATTIARRQRIWQVQGKT